MHDGTKRPRRPQWNWRRGNIVVLAAAVLVVIMGFSAFTVDVGFIALTRTQLQAASDASVLAAAQELPAAFQPGLGNGASVAVTDLARQAAVDLAGLHRAGDRDSISVAEHDLRFGQYRWVSGTSSWEKAWGATPYNLVEVTLRRTTSSGGAGGGDGPLPLFFAPVIGVETADVSTTSAAAMMPGVGFRIVPGSGLTAGVLPIALDVQTWNALLAGSGSDDFRYNPATKQVIPGSDGILEVNLYPTGSNVLPPGNRGTVDLGSPNNSTNDLKRQILYGLNEFDLSYFDGELRMDGAEPLELNGDTGISAGIKDQLETINGQTRAIPLFSEVSGPGNNAMYTIVKFVGIRILDVRLTGGEKHLIVQPAPYSDPTVIPGDVEIATDSIFTTPKLIR
ncbi:MAG: pilus assembly protein TadG-related protein [Planctomycetales bacterium]